MANTYLSRTPSSTGNRKTFTISVWVKRSEISTNQKIFEASPDGSNTTDIRLKTDDTLQVYSEVGGVTKFNLKTNRKFRDTNAWYHIVVSINTTLSSGGDRIKIYVNGVRESSYASATDPTQNFDTLVNFANQVNVIGRRNPYSDFYFNGLMSHFHLTDGYAYDASSFGSTDSTTGEWKINTSPSVTYGTNGFFILKDGNSVTYIYPNSNNFTVEGGTLTKTEDSPSNVFTTFNGVRPTNITLAYGNTDAFSASASWQDITTTLGASSGKFYTEFLCAGGATAYMYGVADLAYANYQGSHMGAGTGRVGYYHGGDVYVSGSSQSYGNSYATGDYIGCALDMDNNKVYFSKNGVWQNSGDPTSGSTGTGAISLPTTGTYGFGTSHKDNSACYANFGNGYFGVGAVSSAGTNASGNGIFEHDVPTGYTALSTKGLNL